MSPASFLLARRRSIPVVAVIAVALVIGGWRIASSRSRSPESLSAGPGTNPQDAASTDDDPGTIDFPRDSWQAAGLQMQPVQSGPLTLSVELTGKISLNEDRIAHIYPLVEGRVHEVRTQLGSEVKKGDLLVVVQSKEVGQARLQLFQNRQLKEFAVTKDRWTQTVAGNTQSLIQLIRDGATIEEIEKQLADRPVGEYRDKLMTAYVSHYKARRTYERLTPLAQGGSISGKAMIEAESDWNGARATMQSLVEQIQQDARQASIVSSQSVKELETRVAVDETSLKILGFDDAALASIDPAKQGESISHYPILAPFDGTIISKDVVLLERVGHENQILSVADLSTVWVTTDIYEEHLPLLARLRDQTIRLRSSAWPGRTFEARIFYTGDVVNESSRTIAMRAIADNRERDLKPGMFVSVEFPSETTSAVVQVPLTAVQEHAGKSFVFVHAGEDRFERRDVVLGARNGKSVEVRNGLKPSEVVVTRGGFALKSRMLADLLAE